MRFNTTMKTAFTIASFAIVGLSLTPSPFKIDAVSAENVAPSALNEQLLQQATSTNPTISQSAIATLRSQGYAGIEAFWQKYQTEFPRNPQLRSVLDAICKQKDCDMSRLYWYTDLEAAKAAAKASGKPILSLRLLGYLDEELSCANSRFFRTALYPNSEVSAVLRDRFILHWQSERPVPKLTIDFGDGRKLERTLTGNSIHYVLDANGDPVDAIPGLYSAQAFLENLLLAEQIAKQSTNLSGSAKWQLIGNYHRDRLAALQTKWNKDLTRLRLPIQPLIQSAAPVDRTNPPSAEVAGRIPIGKALVELPVLRRTTVAAPTKEQAPNTKLSDANWERLSSLYLGSSSLDANSLKVVERKLSSQQSLPATVANFERAIAQDTVRNEYLFHAQIHDWFANGTSTMHLQALNQRVYAELFLTPANDPWLGLVPTNVYTGISAK
ncbi:hypothetical protein V2H45_11655 [Tumidithrix elongata RA019]|uniref:Uncharacterized protein n=1 Tax=Tumidithrix elongata BACA0141 TaxID=2716417 RepID=A0AAW9PWM7_9CYAN|nr:hypothetical protein [Tumidithrix elongata RA019]